VGVEPEAYFSGTGHCKRNQKRYPKAAILFVGALGRMEMEKVSGSRYEIVACP
jgi:hypothetical protein